MTISRAAATTEDRASCCSSSLGSERRTLVPRIVSPIHRFDRVDALVAKITRPRDCNRKFEPKYLFAETPMSIKHLAFVFLTLAATSQAWASLEPADEAIDEAA